MNTTTDFAWSAALPSQTGSYALALNLPEPVSFTVGRLGLFSMQPAALIYVGSAFGPGGLSARVRHHLNLPLHPHWHLDYLRPYVEPLGCLFTSRARPLECRWAQIASACEYAFIPLRGFGAADCHTGCESHLIGFSSIKALYQAIQVMQSIDEENHWAGANRWQSS